MFAQYLTENYAGALMSGLLDLLLLALHTAGEQEASKVVGGALNDEIVLVLLHHRSPAVRRAALRLLRPYLARAGEEQRQRFLVRKRGFHLVAAQLNRHPVDRHLVDACVYLLVGRSVDSTGLAEALVEADGVQQQFANNAAVLLLAVLDKSLASPDGDGVALCSSLLNLLVSTPFRIGVFDDFMMK